MPENTANPLISKGNGASQGCGGITQGFAQSCNSDLGIQ